MKRRQFITLLGGAAAWPLVARAQQPMPVIGLLEATTAVDSVYRVSAFRDGLKEAGFIDGHNVAIDFRSAENKLDRLPALAADLAHRQVAVIVSQNITMHAARAATSTIPIVFVIGSDPIASGLVTSLSHPGGNITGVSFASSPLQPKRLALLHELVPPLTNTIGMVEVAARATRMLVFGPTITATCECARSAASAGRRSSLFSAERNSIAMLWPSMNPASFRPSTTGRCSAWCSVEFGGWGKRAKNAPSSLGHHCGLHDAMQCYRYRAAVRVPRLVAPILLLSLPTALLEVSLSAARSLSSAFSKVVFSRVNVISCSSVEQAEQCHV